MPSPFSASACGCFIVSTAGLAPKVYPIARAMQLAEFYRALVSRDAAAGNLWLAAHCRAQAALIEAAIMEATDSRSAVKRIPRDDL